MNHSAEISALKRRNEDLETRLAALEAPVKAKAAMEAAVKAAADAGDGTSLKRDAKGAVISDPDAPSYDERMQKHRDDNVATI